VINNESFFQVVTQPGGTIDEFREGSSKHNQSVLDSSCVHSDYCYVSTTSRDLWHSICKRTLMDDTPHRRKTDGWFIRPIKLSFIILTVIFFLVLVGFSWVILDVRNNSNRIHNLLDQNATRIQEIQKSRVESCKLTYIGIKKVFTPFAPLPPRTEQQTKDLEKFNRTINALVKTCVKQTKPKSIKQGGNS
jgi:hypothetical protein